MFKLLNMLNKPNSDDYISNIDNTYLTKALNYDKYCKKKLSCASLN